MITPYTESITPTFIDSFKKNRHVSWISSSSPIYVWSLDVLEELLCTYWNHFSVFCKKSYH
jgi:hypothetical protein